MNNYLKCLQFTLPKEIGFDQFGNPDFVNGGLNYLDGEPTKWGFYQKANPDLDVVNMSLYDAIREYKKRYFDIYETMDPPINLEHLSAPIAVALFDSGVNCGPYRAYKWYVEAIKDKEPVETLLALRRQHYTTLKTWPRFKNGWLNRLNDLRKYCEILTVTSLE